VTTSVRLGAGQIGADLGSFVLLDPDKGYLVFSTDFDLSSHLHEFSLSNPGQLGPELHRSLGYAIPVIAYAIREDLLFVPDGASGVEGILVFDATHGTQLTPAPLPLDGRPSDVLVLCRTANN
jgi:hypothetical protein